MKPSHYQQAVYDFVSTGAGNGSVNAVAGSGKTTTAVKMVELFDRNATGAFMAFNSHIKEELNERLGGVCEAFTYNGFGWRAIAAHLGKRPKLDQYKVQNQLRYELLDNLANDADRKWYYKSYRTMTRLMSLVKAADEHREDHILSTALAAAERFAIEVPEKWEQRFMDLWKIGLQTHKMDFDDQKYMAQHLNVAFEQYDYLIIDEYQDTCPVEANMLARACNGRTFVVGDPDQCIYSFKGTTPDAMGVFNKRHAATQLPLSICYRCSKAVVLEAAKIVPRIEYWEGSRTGAVDTINIGEFQERVNDNDFVLCRVTLDLVRSCMRFIRRGRKAYVKGREIGTQLVAFIDSLAKNDFQDALEFYHVLCAYQEKRIAELEAMDRDSAIIYLNDQCDTIKVLIHDVDTVKDLKAKITDLFKDTASGIPHLTIHKSKGLETEGNVYLIAPEKLPHPRAKLDWMKEEERRLEYVAITRAKEGFYRVRSEEEDAE